MAQSSIDQLENAIKAGRIGGVYLFDGPEAWLKDRVVESLIDSIIKPESKDFNLDRFDGDSTSGGEVVSASMNFPFLGDRRLVIVKNTDGFGISDARIIGEAIPQFPASSCVVFLYQGKSNLKEEIPARISEHGTIVTFWTPFPNQLPSWVTSQVQLRGKKITSDAAVELAQVADDLQTLSNEIDKLILYVGTKKIIDGEDIDGYGVFTDSADTRKLETAIWKRDMGQALFQCVLLSEEGVRSEALIPLFQRIFRTLSLGHYLSQKEKRPMSEVYSTLRLRGTTQQNNFQAGLKFYSDGDVLRNFGLLVETDEKVKTGLLSSPVALSLMVTKMLVKRRG